VVAVNGTDISRSIEWNWELFDCPWSLKPVTMRRQNMIVPHYLTSTPDS
jgi:hypothetical protein